MRTISRRLLSGAGALLIAASAIPFGGPASAAVGDSPISGRVFVDANADGRSSAAGYIDDAPYAGATVSAFDSAGASTTASTDASGAYSLDVSTIGSGPFRIELTVPAGYESAPFGLETETTVRQSVAAGSSGVNFGLEDPGSYCSANPRMVVSCFTGGDPLLTFPTYPTSGQASSHSIRYDQTGYQGQAGYQPTSVVTNAGTTGTIYGVGWSKSQKSLYYASSVRRHAGLGPGGMGAIYQVDPDTGATLSTITVPNTGTAPSPRDLSGSATVPSRDIDAFAKVAVTGLGDLDVSPDGNTLYTINLNTRELVVIGGLSGTPVQQSYSVQSVASCPGGAGDVRPFGLGQRNVGGAHKVYVGVSCSGETNRVAAEVTGQVIEFDVASGSWGPIVSQFPLGGTPKGCALVDTAGVGGLGCSWNVWSNNWTDAQRFQVLGEWQVSNPQPVVAEIEFDQSGAMVLGIADRGGWQWGFKNYPPAASAQVCNIFGCFTDTFSPTNQFHSGVAAGDQLRACPTGATFTLESNGSCGGVTTAGAGNSQGPGGGEYYWGDASTINPPLGGTQGHQELGLGGLSYVPGRTTMAATVTDPYFTLNGTSVFHGNTTGIAKLAHVNDPSISATAGAWVGGYEIATEYNGNTYGKSGGLGDIEVLCEEAPVEIGNYVWFDADRDGVQDPDEVPLAGVRVQLVDPATGAVVATAITDATGRYLFASEGAGNVVAAGLDGPGAGDDDPQNWVGIVADPDGDLSNGTYGLSPNTAYRIEFDKSAATISPALVALGVTSAAELNLTDADQSPVDIRDSDATAAGTVDVINMVTGGPGQNNHSFDVGYWAAAVEPTTTTTTTVPPTTTTTSTTVPPTTSTTTTAPPTSTTTSISSRSIVATPQVSSPPPAAPQGSLAYTGSNLAVLAVGVLLVAVGSLATAASKKRKEV